MARRETVHGPYILDGHQHGAIPARVFFGQASDNGVMGRRVRVAVFFLFFVPGMQTVLRMKGRAEGKRHRGADDRLAAPLENPSFAQGLRAAPQNEIGAGADDGMSLPVVAKSQRRRVGKARRLREVGQYAAIGKRDGLRLQIHRAQDQLGGTTGRADHKIEVVSGPRAALTQGAFLRDNGDAAGQSQRDQRQDHQRQQTIAPPVGENERERVHCHLM